MSDNKLIRYQLRHKDGGDFLIISAVSEQSAKRQWSKRFNKDISEVILEPTKMQYDDKGTLAPPPKYTKPEPKGKVETKEDK